MKLRKIPKELRIDYPSDEAGWGVLVAGINILQSYLNMIIEHINEHEKPGKLTEDELLMKQEASAFEIMIEERMEKAQQRLKEGGGDLTRLYSCDIIETES